MILQVQYVFHYCGFFSYSVIFVFTLLRRLGSLFGQFQLKCGLSSLSVHTSNFPQQSRDFVYGKRQCKKARWTNEMNSVRFVFTQHQATISWVCTGVYERPIGEGEKMQSSFIQPTVGESLCHIYTSLEYAPKKWGVLREINILIFEWFLSLKIGSRLVSDWKTYRKIKIWLEAWPSTFTFN